MLIRLTNASDSTDLWVDPSRVIAASDSDKGLTGVAVEGFKEVVMVTERASEVARRVNEALSGLAVDGRAR